MGDTPEGRRYHTAVWTGSLMIVWGGQKDLLANANTGGRYDPATDTWSQVSTLNAPLGTAFATAVWTGKEMIVFGGSGSSLDRGTRTIGRYDPVRDRWDRNTYPNGSVPGRFLHTAVWTGRYMIIWGGVLSFSSPFLGDGWKYDPTTETDVPTSLSAPTAVWTGSLMIVWGQGSAGSGGGRYDPEQDRWIPVSFTNAPSPRVNQTAVWTGSLMVVWGGRAPSDYGGP